MTPKEALKWLEDEQLRLLNVIANLKETSPTFKLDFINAQSNLRHIKDTLNSFVYTVENHHMTKNRD